VIRPELTKEVSTVKEYDPQNGLGIVVREDGSELRFSRADLISIPEAEAAIVQGAKLYHAVTADHCLQVEVCLPEQTTATATPAIEDPSRLSTPVIERTPVTWSEVVAQNRAAWERVRRQYPKGPCFEEIPEP
jgi:hypothetical protein